MLKVWNGRREISAKSSLLGCITVMTSLQEGTVGGVKGLSLKLKIRSVILIMLKQGVRIVSIIALSMHVMLNS